MFDILWVPVPFITNQWYGINYSIPIVDTLEESFSTLNTFELILLAPSIGILTYFIVFINSITLFHRNISILFNYILFWIVVGYFAKFYILLIRAGIVEKNSNLLFLASLLRLECYGNILTVQSTLVVERIFATNFFSDYEKNHRLWINFIVVPLTFLTAQFYSIPLFLFNVPLILPLGYCIGMTFWSFFVINYLYSSNSRKLAHLKLNPIMYTLSKKFQLEENIRIMWYFRGTMFAFICLSSLLAAFLLAPSIFDIFQVSFKSVIRSIDMAIISLCIFFPLGMFCALYHVRHPAFLRRHEWLFGRRENLRKQRVLPISEEEANVYFIQLEHSWR